MHKFTLFSLAYYINNIGLAAIFVILFFYQDYLRRRINRCGSSAGFFYAHGCFHLEMKVMPSGSEASCKDRGEQRACSTVLRGETSTPNYPGFHIQV